MSLMSVGNLESLGRRQLQQLCKKCGIKANKKNVELIASLREVQALANQSPADSGQGNMAENHDSSHVVKRAMQCTSPQARPVVLCSLRDTTKLPETQNQDASEVNQLAISPKDSPHSRNLNEATVPLTRKLLDVSAVGGEEDNQPQGCLAAGCDATELPQVGSSDELKNDRDQELPTKRKRKSTDEAPPKVLSLQMVQSVGDAAAELLQVGTSNDSKNDREPPAKRKRKGTYEIPPEVSSLKMVQDPTSITYPVQSGKGDVKEEILEELSKRVARRREMGDVPSVKSGKNVCPPFHEQVPQTVQKSGQNWSKVHAKLFQKMESIDDYNKRRITAKKIAMTTKGSRIPISKTSNKGKQNENRPQAPKAGVFTFGSKKEAKPRGMPFDLAASLKRTPKSYTPYRGPVPKFES